MALVISNTMYAPEPIGHEIRHIVLQNTFHSG